MQLPIDPSTSADVTVDTSFGSHRYRIKGGQLLHTIYSLVEELWYRADSPVISSPSEYRGPAFWNIDIVATPTQLLSHRPLTTVEIQFALYTIAEALVRRPRWPSSIAARVRARDTTEIVGLVEITDALHV